MQNCRSANQSMLTAVHFKIHGRKCAHLAYLGQFGWQQWFGMFKRYLETNQGTFGGEHS